MILLPVESSFPPVVASLLVEISSVFGEEALAPSSSDFSEVSLVGSGATIVFGEEALASSSSDFSEVSLVGSGATLLSAEEVFSASVELVIPSVTETFAGSLLVSSA